MQWKRSQKVKILHRTFKILRQVTSSGRRNILHKRCNILMFSTSQNITVCFAKYYDRYHVVIFAPHVVIFQLFEKMSISEKSGFSKNHIQNFSKLNFPKFSIFFKIDFPKFSIFFSKLTFFKKFGFF